MHNTIFQKFRKACWFGLLLFTSFWLISCEALADAPKRQIDQVSSGSLMFLADEPGKYIPAPALATDVQLDVTGPIIRARVTQKFINNSQTNVEALGLSLIGGLFRKRAQP